MQSNTIPKPDVNVGFELIPNNKREYFYPQLTAGNLRDMMALENFFYNRMTRSSDNYAGGYFDFVKFPNGAVAALLRPATDKKWDVEGVDNHYSGQMTPLAFSAACFALACNRLAHATSDMKSRQSLTNNWQLLMDVLYEHEMFEAERDEISKFLD